MQITPTAATTARPLCLHNRLPDDVASPLSPLSPLSSHHQTIELSGLERVVNAVPRPPPEVFKKIASFLISNPTDILSISLVDKRCAESLRGERMFCKSISRVENISAQDLTLDAFGALLIPILNDIPSIRLAGDALLRLVTKMRFPPISAGGKWLNKILQAQHIYPAKKAEVLAVLAQKSNILRVDKSAFTRILAVVNEMPPALRSAETVEQVSASNKSLTYHQGALVGLVALCVTQPTEVKKHEAMVDIISALQNIPEVHRSGPLYQLSWFLGYFKDRQQAFDRIINAVTDILPSDRQIDVLQRLRSETWRLPIERRECAVRTLTTMGVE